jgi:hypothetical protein
MRSNFVASLEPAVRTGPDFSASFTAVFDQCPVTT